MRFATGAVLLLVVAGCATSYSGSQQNTTDDLLAELREIRDSRPIVEVEYDRFEEQTRYTSTRSAVLQSEYVVGNFFYLALTAWGQCEGEEGCIPEQVVF